ncbi:MAG TPA: GAF and ANTAR domain-containing protein [Mycobacteriales bacterium]|nr:GAF and ANTAR domain-containing protein [Mycobacteriales bacterium]
MDDISGIDRHDGDDEPANDGSPTVDDLAMRLADLARSMQGEEDVQATLDAIVHATVDTVPGARHASISTIRARREVYTQASTDDLPRALDQAQYDTGQGPCLDALFQQQTVRLDDLASEPRWRAFTALARELGAGSMLCVQLYVDGERGNLGALNVSSGHAHAFTDESAQIALVLAAHAAVAMSDAQTAAQLRAAVSSRDLIGMAKGVLIERHRLTPERAFTVLVRASQHGNRKLLDVARELVETGSLSTPVPGRPGPPSQRRPLPTPPSAHPT